MLEEVTTDTDNLGLVEITVSVGLLATTIDDVAGNGTVSFRLNIQQIFAHLTLKVLACFCKYGCCTKIDCIIKFNPRKESR